MYLSRVEINPRRRDTMQALASPEVLHATVMASFPAMQKEGNDRILWRVDELDPSTYVLVQSQIKPDFTHIIEQFGWPESGQRWDTVEYDNFLMGIKDGDVRKFRIRANPTRSIKQSDEKNARGKVCQHITAEQQLQWFIEKSRKCGFSVEGPGQDVKIMSRDNLKFRNKNNCITLAATVFEGTLRVEDASTFVDTIKNGLGRAKAYGFGMVTVSRAIE
ncbi:MAG: type I-E CRISPR-associated protein Cas6/Cse3/CasE [Methanosarcina mazei]|nr:type I-E CRISPR-associated protein Cas6/Cse3/CasE [Methanosarcina mazei]